MFNVHLDTLKYSNIYKVGNEILIDCKCTYVQESIGVVIRQLTN